MSKKLHIKTWGCQMNEYDSSKMADLLGAAHGYQATELPEEADVLVLNTCSIREKAQEKLFHQLGRWKELKKRNPRITSYNVCYTKLLRVEIPVGWNSATLGVRVPRRRCDYKPYSA